MLTREDIFSKFEAANFQEIRIHFPDGIDRAVYPILAYDFQNPRRPVGIADVTHLIVNKCFGYACRYETVFRNDPLGELAEQFNKINALHPLRPSGLTKFEEFQAEESRLRAYYKKQEAEGWTKNSIDFYAEWYKDLYHITPIHMPHIPT